MSRRGHFSFNKRQREAKQKEKRQKKQERRLAKRSATPGGGPTEHSSESAITEIHPRGDLGEKSSNVHRMPEDS